MHVNSSTGMSNGTSSGTVALYAGSSIAVFLTLIGFIAFAINRSLRIKRQHIISINICFSLTIYYIGFLISLTASEMKRVNGSMKTTTPACVTGAIVVLLGWLCWHTWLLSNWVYLSFTIQQRVSRHISHFLIKSTIPAYGSALLFLVITVAMTTNLEDQNEVYNDLCWYNIDEGSSTEWTFSVSTTICAVGIVICATTCCVEFVCKSDKNASVARMKKNKRSVARLSVLTLIAVITSSLHLSSWLLAKRQPKSGNMQSSEHHTDFNWLKILHGVFIGLEGVAVTLYLIVPTDDFQSIFGYCTAMIKCQDPTNTLQHRSINSTTRSSKHIDNNNVMDLRESVASDDRPVKFEPREDVPRDLATASGDPLENYSATLPMDKNRAKARASTLKHEKGGTPSSKPPKDPKKKGIRASFRLPTKFSSPNISLHTPKAETPPSTSPINRYKFSRDSKVSMGIEHERKTSF